MSGGKLVNKGKGFFSLTASVLLILNALIIGITLEVPNASAGSMALNAGELQINMLTDFGRIFLPLQWPYGGTLQTVSNNGFGYMGLVVDQQNYDHTPGSTDIADCYTLATANYMSIDDFSTITPSELVIDTPAMDKMIASFQNTGTTQDPNDILINLTAWSVQNKDWAIIQWHVNNIKSPSTDILNFKIGFEVDISQEGGTYGLGGDSGDDIDGFDAAEDVYWAQDNAGAGVSLGFASAIVSDPINHYYSEDYHPATYDDYKTMWEDEDWLYGRINAANQAAGATPGNRTSTVGWNGFTIPAGGSRTLTMVIAMNNTYSSMITAINDAQWYYKNVLTGFLITEFSDSEGSHQIEVYNNGREPTDTSTFDISIDGGSTFLAGNWNPVTIQTYDYSVFTVTGGGAIGQQGDSIGLYENSKLIDKLAFGQEGVVPDPTSNMSVGRYYDTDMASYTDDWAHHLTSGNTFGSHNNVGSRVTAPWIIINRVMYNPSIAAEGYVEIMYRGFSPVGLNISNYMVVANDGYTIPGPITLNVTNKFYVFCQSDMPAFFSNLGINGDNVYLYDASGNLLDMVGWSSPHKKGESMHRVPDGNGTWDGFDDVSSIAAGWVFGNETEPPPPPPSPPKDLMAVLINDAEEVLLTWNASSDDGAGDNDIAGYTVYRSSTGVNGSYDFAAWIVANGSLSYSWIDINAGDGDWNNYFYIVRANDTLDLEELNTNKAGKFTNYLVKSWNLMSVPLIQANTTMEYVLQTIEGNYIIIQGYHAGKSRPWLHLHKNKPKYFNDEIEINHKEGYYIKMINPDYLIVAGRVPVNTHIPLKTGWNLIGYPCLVNKTRDDALSSISGKYNMVEYYDPVKCKEVRLGPNDFMQPGLGYWIHATEDCVLIL